MGDRIELNGLDQILWPDHCVENTSGAEFASGLEYERFDEIFRKGAEREIDSYSGFFDNGRRKATGLGEYLEKTGVSNVYILGLATGTESFGDLVRVGATGDEVLEHLRSALGEREHGIDERIRFARLNSWSARAAAYVSFIRTLSDEPAPVAAEAGVQ